MVLDLCSPLLLQQGTGGSKGTHDPSLLWHNQVNPAALAGTPSHTLSVSPSHVHLDLLCQAEGRGAQRSLEGLEFSPRPCSYPHLCLRSPGGIACLPCTCPSQHQLHPPVWHKLYPLPGTLPPFPVHSRTLALEKPPHPSATGPPPPGSVQFSDGHAGGRALASPCPHGGGGGAFLAVGGAQGRACGENHSEWVLGRAGAGGRAQGSRPAARGPWAPSCALSSGPLPLWLLLQEAAAWAAVSMLGGGRVVAGRGLGQEFGSFARRGWGGSVGRGPWGASNACRAECSGFCPLGVGWRVLPESLSVATHFCLRPPPGGGARGDELTPVCGCPGPWPRNLGEAVGLAPLQWKM